MSSFPTDKAAQVEVDGDGAIERLVYVMPECPYSGMRSGKISSRDLWDILWGGKWIMIAVTAVFALGSVAYALTATEWFRSEALLARAEEKSTLEMDRQLGGLVALAGVTVDGGDSAEALAVLGSGEFARSFIEDFELLLVFFADKWDAPRGRWLGDDPKNLRRRERDQIERLINRLEADLASLAMQATRTATAQAGTVDHSFGVGQALLSQLRRAEPMGRLVIDLRAVMREDESHDAVLKDGDQLLIPERSQKVVVLGEVQDATAHIHAPGPSRDDFIAASGGPTANADRGRIYIVRAHGAVVAGQGRNAWFKQSDGMEIRPGDTIVVLMNIDRMPALAMWQSVTSILFNLAVSAVGSL